MKKSIIAILLCLLLCLSGCKKDETVKITGEDTRLATRLENIVELQKSLFRAEITGVETVNAVMTKYNLDISKYTMYTVNIVESYDGYTPTGPAHVYWAGTPTEFITRVGLKQNETYILDADPWVYGDEVVYLLYPSTVSYPKVDVAGGLTIAVSDTEALSVGSLESYRQEYDDAVKSVDLRIEGHSDIKNAVERYQEIFETVLTKNSDKEFFSRDDLKFDWKPSDDFIAKTINKSQAVYDKAMALDENTSKEQITDLMRN